MVASWIGPYRRSHDLRDKWQFVNFNGKVIACQAGHGLAVKTSGNFATYRS
jgi:hypothetical protein